MAARRLRETISLKDQADHVNDGKTTSGAAGFHDSSSSLLASLSNPAAASSSSSGAANRGGRDGGKNALLLDQRENEELPNSEPSHACRTAVYAWGRDDLGQAGSGPLGDAPDVPRKLDALDGAAALHVALAPMASLCVGADGALYTWGCDESMQLARDRVDGEGGSTSSRVPPGVVASLRASVVRHASLGESHGAAVTADGLCVAWGSADQGQTAGDDSARIAHVGTGPHRPRLVRCPVGQPTPKIRFVRVACGAHHTLLLSPAGGAFSFGQGSFGALGLGDYETRSAPCPVAVLRGAGVVQVACGDHHSVALDASGAVFVWGRGTHGQLGLGRRVRGCVCEPVALLPPCAPPLPPRSQVSHISAGGDHAAAVTTRGEALTWGRNAYGQCGAATDDRPCLVEALRLHRVHQVACGSAHTLLVASPPSRLSAGMYVPHRVVYAMGDNSRGQLGVPRNEVAASTRPLLVRGLPRFHHASDPEAVTLVASVSAGGDTSAAVLLQKVDSGFRRALDAITPALLPSTPSRVNCSGVMDGWHFGWGNAPTSLDDAVTHAGFGNHPLVLPSLLELLRSAERQLVASEECEVGGGVEAMAIDAASLAAAVEGSLGAPGVVVHGFRVLGDGDADGILGGMSAEMADADDAPPSFGMDVAGAEALYSSLTTVGAAYPVVLDAALGALSMCASHLEALALAFESDDRDPLMGDVGDTDEAGLGDTGMASTSSAVRSKKHKLRILRASSKVPPSWLKCLPLLLQNPLIAAGGPESRRALACIGRVCELIHPTWRMHIARWLSCYSPSLFRERFVAPCVRHLEGCARRLGARMSADVHAMGAARLLAILRAANSAGGERVPPTAFVCPEASEKCCLRTEYLRWVRLREHESDVDLESCALAWETMDLSASWEAAPESLPIALHRSLHHPYHRLAPDAPACPGPLRSLCQVPFTLTAECKARLVRAEADLQRRREAARAEAREWRRHQHAMHQQQQRQLRQLRQRRAQQAAGISSNVTMAGTGGIAGVDDVDPFDSAGNVMGMDADAMDAPMGGESAAAQVQQQDKRFLELRIRRAHIAEDALRGIAVAAREDGPRALRRLLRIRFVSHGVEEEAIDEGGVTREFFQLLTRELFAESFGICTFDSEVHRCWLTPMEKEPLQMSEEGLSAEEKHLLLGATIGLAVYAGVSLDAPLCSAAFRFLAGFKPRLRDLETWQPTLARSLRCLLAYDEDAAGVSVEEAFSLTFQVSVPGERKVKASGESMREYREVELLPGGKDMTVTRENRRKYVDLYLQLLMGRGCARRLGAICTGFRRCCGGPALSLLEPHELELLICGTEELDMDALKENARYEGGYESLPTSTDEVRTSIRAVPRHDNVEAGAGAASTSAESTSIDASAPSTAQSGQGVGLEDDGGNERMILVWFWRILDRMNFEDKQKFLFFTTGCARAPIGGLRNVRLTVQRPGGDTERLPTAHTCFDTLLLPEYHTEEKLERKLRLAISNAEGFGLC
ncbi:hypothetical protein PPROV_000220700 [Pycnococcus provasolii]|uniref:HECT domain-containing protein n=1 Tax=Pycnococcus provasolii TaxID=41880 RepID=A0A830H9Z1_9CHLO|nr:hypothetical protein PPROV_000220700 [Pycnococcus provasolii]